MMRLDPDWYESTRVEMDYLFDRVVPGVVVIFDDYGWWNGHRRAIDEYLAMLSGGNYDFVYAHWPFPHRPFVKADGSNGDYGDNLELIDRVVGKVRRTLEAKGVWDESLVIITSDHWWLDRVTTTGKAPAPSHRPPGAE